MGVRTAERGPRYKDGGRTGLESSTLDAHMSQAGKGFVSSEFEMFQSDARLGGFPNWGEK